MAGTKNDTLIGKNADFSQAGGPNATSSDANGLNTNGQLWIGSTALNVGGTHVNVGALTCPDSSVTIGYSSPNITLQAGGNVPLQFTENSGSAAPVLNNINILGTTAAAGTSPLVTSGAGSTVTITAQRSQALAAGDSTKVGLANFDSGDFTVSVDGFVVLAGGGAGQTITGDTGGALSPTAGNWNILGQQASTTPVMFTIGSGSTLNIEDRTWTTSLVVDPSATVGLRGTFQTITAALAAASSGQTIFIRPGTYTENITMVAGVNLQGYSASGESSNTVINGTITCSYTGTCSISGLTLAVTNADNITITGANALFLNISNCVLTQNSNAGTQYFLSCANANATFNMFKCRGTGTANSTIFNITATATGSLTNFNRVEYCYFPNTSNNLISTVSQGTLLISYCNFQSGLAVSNATVEVRYSNIGRQGFSSKVLGVTNSGVVFTYETEFNGNSGGTVPPITVDATSTLVFSDTVINMSTAVGQNLVSVTAGGVFKYDVVRQIGNMGSTSIPIPAPTDINDSWNYFGQVTFKQGQSVNVTTPGAYPYTTLLTDYVILVDTSSARTILADDPITGRIMRIKDSVGSAAANNITIDPAGKNIDGQTTYLITTNYGSVDIVYNGTEWNVI